MTVDAVDSKLVVGEVPPAKRRLGVVVLDVQVGNTKETFAKRAAGGSLCVFEEGVRFIAHRFA